MPDKITLTVEFTHDVPEDAANLLADDVWKALTGRTPRSHFGQLWGYGRALVTVVRVKPTATQWRSPSYDAMDRAADELEAEHDLRDIPDEVLDALDKARALVRKLGAK